MITITPSTVEHAIRLGPRLRPLDALEIKSVLGATPIAGLMAGLEGEACLTGTVDGGRPIFMAGVSKDPSTSDPEAGVPWLLGTYEINAHAFEFARGSKRFLNAFHKVYPKLSNIVHEDNHSAIRWLKWLGFTFWPDVIGCRGERFICFERIR